MRLLRSPPLQPGLLLWTPQLLPLPLDSALSSSLRRLTPTSMPFTSSMPFSPNRSIARRRSEKNKVLTFFSFPSPLFNLRRKKKLETMRRSRSRSPVRDSRGRDRDRDRDRDRGDYGGGSGSGYGYSRGGGGGGGYENNDRRGGGREQGAPKVGLCSPWTCFEASRQAQA